MKSFELYLAASCDKIHLTSRLDILGVLGKFKWANELVAVFREFQGSGSWQVTHREVTGTFDDYK
jgi:hypothetical protein